MAAVNPPIFIHQESHPADRWRRVLGAVVARPGILTAGAFAVAQHAGTPDMSVDVAEGLIAVPGTESTYQGLYVCEAQGVTQVPLDPADLTNARKDLVIARVTDSNYSGATRLFAVTKVTGTAAASPVDPALPANSWALARVDIPAADTAITTGQLTDLRVGAASYTQQNGRAASVGGIVTATSAARPNVAAGGVTFQTDNSRFLGYDGSGWVDMVGLGAWDTSFVTQIFQSVSVSKTTVYSRFRKLGRSVRWQAYLQITSAGTSNQPVRLTLPYTAAATSLIVGKLYWFSGPSNTPTNVNIIYDAVIPVSTNLGGLINFSASTVGQTVGGHPDQLRVGDALLLDVEYESTT